MNYIRKYIDLQPTVINQTRTFLREVTLQDIKYFLYILAFMGIIITAFILQANKTDRMVREYYKPLFKTEALGSQGNIGSLIQSTIKQ